MGGAGGLPAEQHPAQQGRHSGGSPPRMEAALASLDGQGLEMRLNAVSDLNRNLVFEPCFPTSQSVVSGVTTAYNREQLWLANETLITKLQARCRGYLVRKGLKERMEYLKANEAAVTNIQVATPLEMRLPSMSVMRRVRGQSSSPSFLNLLFSGSLERLQTKEEVQRSETVSERPQR